MKFSIKAFGLFALLTTFVASGCGGSGSDSAIDQNAGTDSATSTTSLTLSGLVTDDPIINADVVFKVGDREFSGAVPTGSQGEFQIQIDSNDPDALVTGSAYDAANNVRLTAVLDTYEGCIELARNNVVNSVKITNITTAQQVLAERLAADGQIDSYAEYLSLVPQIDATELLELSSLIKVVVENIGGTVLPSGTTDTLTLARAIADGTSSFEADLEMISPGAMDEAKELLLSDGHATLPFVASNATGVYVSTDNQFIYAVFDNGSALVDYFGDQSMSTLPSWSITDDGKLQFSYYGFERDNDSLTLLSVAENALHVVTDSSDAGDQRIVSAATKLDFGNGFDQATAAGAYADPRNPENSLVLETGGSGSFVQSGQQSADTTLAWSVNAEGHLIIEFDDSPRTLEIINLLGDSQSQVLTITRFNGQFPTLAVGALAAL